MIIHVGVVGSGLIGPVHVGALQRIPGINVKALSDVDETTAKKKAEMLGIKSWYGDYRQMLEDPQISAIHVCVPNHLHHRVSFDAIETGKHVICEKPLALTTEEAMELLEAAQRAGVVHAVHYNLRYYPLMRQLKMMVDNGELGDIISVHGSYLQDWLLKDTDFNWRLESDVSGESRAVADIGSHWMDLVEYVSGMKIAEVFADYKTVHATRKKPKISVDSYANMMIEPDEYAEAVIDTEDFASVLYRFEQGERGALTVSQVSAGRKNRLSFELAGSIKSAFWDSETPNQLWLGNRDKANEILLKDPSLVHEDAALMMTLPGGHNEGFHDATRALFCEVYEDIRKGRMADVPKYPTFADGLREVKIIGKITQSHREQQWKKIN